MGFSVRTGRIVVAALALTAALALPTLALAKPQSLHLRKADAALVKQVNRYWKGLGFHRNARAAIKAAHLPPAVARALAAELKQLRACDVITRANINTLIQLFGGHTGFPLGTPGVNPIPVQRQGSTVLGVPIPPSPNPPRHPEYPFEPQVEACGAAVVTKLDAVKSAITSHHVRNKSSLDLWPVLRFQPGSGHNTYTHDYVLLVDTGSNNTFLNNAGANVLDIWRGPPHQHAAIVAPARGCIDAFDIIRSRTCTLAAGALLDLGGHNTFGRLEPPDPQTDGVCTQDRVERRVFVQGTGLLGVGVLVDEGSYNTYIGKVLTTGTGHVGGYGYLRDDGSYNHYTVIRDGLGDAVVGGTGTMIANGDHNSYTYYVPGAFNPFVTPGSGYPGSGGVVDDLNNCDAGTGITLGSGEVGGVGHFQATGGHNSYNAPIDSLGSGTVGGAGTFSDTHSGLTDAYSGPGDTGGRGTGKTVAATTSDNGTFTDG